jgi:hypothetical protein
VSSSTTSHPGRLRTSCRDGSMVGRAGVVQSTKVRGRAAHRSASKDSGSS